MDITQITLAQLPYTGFDYGSMYNSLFWIALSIWSLIVSAIIVKNKNSIAKVAYNATRIFRTDRMIDTNTETIAINDIDTEPVVLSERVVRYDPLADIQKDISDITIPEVSEDVRDLVRNIVEEELKISREGESQDEFSQDDFATVDFDGVNPDVYWQPRGGVESVREKEVPKIINNPTPPKATKGDSEESQDLQAEVVEIKKTYSDKITLDKSGEYPKMILNRTEV